MAMSHPPPLTIPQLYPYLSRLPLFRCDTCLACSALVLSCRAHDSHVWVRLTRSSQVTEAVLLELLKRMFSEGEGAARLMAQVNKTAHSGEN